MTLTDMLVPTYRQMLTNLSQWLEKARAQLGSEKADRLLAARLAEDMYPLATQVRFCCVQAIEGMSQIARREFPTDRDVLLEEGRKGAAAPGTIDDAQSRIALALAYVDEIENLVQALEPGALVHHQLPDGSTLPFNALQYVRDWALPQFDFHLLMTYAILRREGVELGKADYVAHLLPMLQPASAPG